MMDRGSDILPTPRLSSVVLDYGVDADACAVDDGELSGRGMRLKSHWSVELGSQLAVAMVHPGPRASSRKVAIDAIVVWCEPKGERCYETTLLFLELPEDQNQYL